MWVSKHQPTPTVGSKHFSLSPPPPPWSYGKLFEKIIFQHLYSFSDTNYLISKNQCGFRPECDSAVNQLVIFVNETHKAFDQYESLESRAVISKAFHKIWQDGLIFKLKYNDVTGSVLTLLTNRKQRVVLNGSLSEVLPNLVCLKVTYWQLTDFVSVKKRVYWTLLSWRCGLYFAIITAMALFLKRIQNTVDVEPWPTINMRPHIMHFKRLVFSYTE